jgi:hypothetical protein
VQAALAAEEEQRLRALEKHAASSGETRWALSIQQIPRAENALNVVTAGFGDIDRWDGDEPDISHGINDQDTRRGRRKFGKVLEAKQPADDSESDSSNSTSSNLDDDDDDAAAQLIRETRKEVDSRARHERNAKRKAPSKERNRMAEERRRKHIKLNG